MDVGFVILCPDRNIRGLRNTLNSILYHSYNRDSICVVGNDVTAKELKEMKEMCQTYKGDNTFTSLINLGIKKSKHEWSFIIFAGSRFPPYLERKLDTFCKNETDVLFPVVDRMWSFIDGSFNGVLINSKFFEKVGDFPPIIAQKEGLNDFELAKMIWYMEATGHGAIFKAIVGMHIN